MTSSQQIMVIDDDPVNIEIVSAFLEPLEHRISTETNSLQAWERLRAAPSEYDIVLLDWVMPDLDGLALLKQIKSHPQLAATPVIMQTAKGQKGFVAEAIAAGAFYFLTKPLDPDELVAIVKAAAEEIANTRHLQNELRRERQSMQKLQQGTFHIRTLSEAHDIGISLANACLEPEKVVIGLNELLVNAVEHGNLGITYEQKSRLKQNDTWLEEIQRRLADSAYKDRMVEISFQRRNGSVTITITDNGDGFEWHKYLEFDPERAFDSHGRGIALSKLMSFDSLEYNGKGNSVTVRMPSMH